MGNRYRAVATFDLLFCAIPIMLMLHNVLVFSAMAGDKVGADVEMLSVEARLLAVSDYVVRYAGVERGEGIYRPNSISGAELADVDGEELGERMGLENLRIGWEAEGGNCIYRLVVYGENIEKLYFCCD